MSLLLSPLDGRVTLKGLLGAGGMGEVHRAWDAALERPVAVKFVRGSDPREADRLLLEARLQARVEHPHVVRVHDTGTLEGRPCIVLQLVEGRTFADLAPESDWRIKVRLAAQAARGLGAAHRTGLVHRDVKPANLLVEDTGEGPMARLSDFGLARDEEGGLTRSGLLMGTVDFMAPEQILGHAPVDFRADVYGLGATLYAVLAGRPPFREAPSHTADAPNTFDLHGETSQREHHPGELLRRVLEQDPPSLVSEVQGLPKELAIVVAKAMEKDPVQRYTTAEALADDLERVLRGESIHARPLGWGERTLRWTRRNPVATRALGVGLIALLAAGGFVVWNSRLSTLEALEAARLGALAESMEARIRWEHMAPSHSIQHVLDWVQGEASRLASSGAKSGASQFARGRAFELVGNLEEALHSYRLAWEAGFRSPEVGESLGLASVKMFNQEVRRAKASLSPERFQRRLQELEATLVSPVYPLLERGDPHRWRVPWAHSMLATTRGDFEGGRAWARRLQVQDPQRYEAWILEAQIWLWEAEQRLKEGKRSEGLQALDRAEQGLMRAIQWGRSNPQVPLLLSMLHTTRTLHVGFGGQEMAGETEQAAGWLSKARAMSPSDPEVSLQHALVKLATVRNPGPGGLASTLPEIDEAIQILQRVHAHHPRAIMPLQKLATGWLIKAQVRYSLGLPVHEEVKQGMECQRRLVSLAPEDPYTHFLAQVFYLVAATGAHQFGEDFATPARASVAAGRETLRRDPAMALQAGGKLVQALSVVGMGVWAQGGDPRPDLKSAVDEAESYIKKFPGNSGVLFEAVTVYVIAADQLLCMGGDVGTHLDRAEAIAQEGLKLNAQQGDLLAMVVKIQAVRAYWRMLMGDDPKIGLHAFHANLALAEKIKPGDLQVKDARYYFASALARWNMAHGIDPTAPLRDAERVIKTLDPKNAQTRVKEAQMKLLHGLRAGKGSPRSREMAAAGVAILNEASQRLLVDPEANVLLARLYALKGDLESAKQSLARAKQRNSLVVEGHEYRQAEQDIWAGGSPQ